MDDALTRAEVQATVRRLHEYRDRRDPDRGGAAISPNRRFEDAARGEMPPGPEACTRDHHRWRPAFPECEVKVANVIVEGNRAVVEVINRGARTGPLSSALGDVPPGGRLMEVRYRSVMRVRDGMLAEGRDYCGSASIARQVGLVA